MSACDCSTALVGVFSALAGAALALRVLRWLGNLFGWRG